MRINNPFLLVGYLGKEYFCDREHETKRIISSIKNGRNINIYNIRRIGKTALIKHALAHLDKNFEYIFIDIEKTENQSALIELLVNSITRRIDKIDNNYLRRITKWLSSIGAAVEVTEKGLKATFHAKNKIDSKTLEEAFELTGLLKKRTFVFAIDEFQQILNYPEKNTEAIFRSIMQKFPNIRFIYSGSSKHMMELIFNSVNAPFYQSTENIEVGYIDENKYLNFARKFLKADDSILTYILNWTRRHTYYTQYAFNKLYEIENYGHEVYSKEDLEFYSVADITLDILLAHKPDYYNYRNLLSKDQWKILRHIAKNEPVSKPTSNDFSKKVGLAPSTLKYNLDQLLKKDILLKENDGLKVYNVFFGKLLAIDSLDIDLN